MSADMKSYVSELLEGYRARERKIAVLRYDLEHPSEVGVTEQIEAMNYGSGEGVGHSKGHISNKTLYIALNYEEQAKQLNAESAKEIADELDLPINTVKTKIRRAKALLLKMMEVSDELL